MWRDRREHYGVEQLIQYGATYSEDGREVINQLNGRAFGDGEKLVFALRD